MFVTVATATAFTHEGRLCRPDNLTARTVAPGGGRGEGLPSPANALTTKERAPER